MMISLTLAQNTFIMANGNWSGQQSSHDGWTLGIVDTLLFINMQNNGNLIKTFLMKMEQEKIELFLWRDQQNNWAVVAVHLIKVGSTLCLDALSWS